MKTLSVKQPWAYLLCAGIKPIENRTWKTNFRGRVFVHASGKSDFKNPLDALNDEQWNELKSKIFEIGSLKYEFSAIIGSIEIVDCVLNHESIWAQHETTILKDGVEIIKPVYNWVIANPILFAHPWLNIKGKLGLWDFENMEGLYDVTQVK